MSIKTLDLFRYARTRARECRQAGQKQRVYTLDSWMARARLKRQGVHYVYWFAR